MWWTAYVHAREGTGAASWQAAVYMWSTAYVHAMEGTGAASWQATVYMWSTAYVLAREGTGTASCNALEADRLQCYRLAATAIAHWYSYFFRHFRLCCISLRCSFKKGGISSFLVFKITWFWNCLTWNCANRDVSILLCNYFQFTKVHCFFFFFKVPRLRLFFLSVRAVCRWRWVWSMGGMILAGIILSTQKETCSSATLSTAYLTWTGSGSNQGRRGERPATSRQS